MDTTLLIEAAGGDVAAWDAIVSVQAPRVWDHAAQRGAGWQAVDASEAAFLNLADRCAEVDADDVDRWLLSEADDAMRLVQAATWRTPRPVVVDADALPAPVAEIAVRALDLRIADAERFAPSDLDQLDAGSDVVVPWRDGGEGFGGALISWYRRYILGEQRLDVSLLTDSARRLLLYPAPDVENCWVRTPDGSVSLDRDDLGYWRGTDVPEVPLSFAVTRPGGSVVTTEWVTV